MTDAWRLRDRPAKPGDDSQGNAGIVATYSTGLHGIGISRYPVAVFSTCATDGNG
jgi:hypothetical protein